MLCHAPAVAAALTMGLALGFPTAPARAQLADNPGSAAIRQMARLQEGHQRTIQARLRDRLFLLPAVGHEGRAGLRERLLSLRNLEAVQGHAIRLRRNQHRHLSPGLFQYPEHQQPSVAPRADHFPERLDARQFCLVDARLHAHISGAGQLALFDGRPIQPFLLRP